MPQLSVADIELGFDIYDADHLISNAMGVNGVMPCTGENTYVYAAFNPEVIGGASFYNTAQGN